MRKPMLAALVFGLLPLGAFAQDAKPAAPAPQAKAAEPKAAKKEKTEKKAGKKAGKMDKAPAAKAAPAAETAVTEYVPLPAEYGKKFFCPVMGEESTVNPKTLALKYKGKIYYFCCSGCPKKFKRDPEKYAK